MATIGFTAGLMSGIFGIGGGSVRIPLLNIAGMPLLNAFAINMFVIPFAQSIAAYTHRKNIDWNMALYAIIGGILGSLAGAVFTGIIPTFILSIIFVSVAILTVLSVYLDKIAPGLYSRLVPFARNIILGTFILNLITGLRGGSGGSLFPPFLKAMHLDMHKAIATSLFTTIFTAGAAFFIYWHRGNILWLPSLSVLIGSVLGARIGSTISLKTKPMWLKIGLSLFIVVLALLTIYKAI
ncbi:MAG TPA: sulfite exporter TauE/SafE family protein [Bacteroidetes bacterium]|nr:sulfite exporter TauE/SafE family protein [Bacteroidota bacterium]